MPKYRYKGLGCGKYYEVFSPKMLSLEEDEAHNSPCGCLVSACVRVRTIIKPAPPQGFKEWAGDWFKKTYGHEMGERDRAYASEQQELDNQVKELKKEHGIEVSQPTKPPGVN